MILQNSSNGAIVLLPAAAPCLNVTALAPLGAAPGCMQTHSFNSQTRYGLAQTISRRRPCSSASLPCHRSDTRLGTTAASASVPPSNHTWYSLANCQLVGGAVQCPGICCCMVHFSTRRPFPPVRTHSWSAGPEMTHACCRHMAHMQYPSAWHTARGMLIQTMHRLDLQPLQAMCLPQRLVQPSPCCASVHIRAWQRLCWLALTHEGNQVQAAGAAARARCSVLNLCSVGSLGPDSADAPQSDNCPPSP